MDLKAVMTEIGTALDTHRRSTGVRGRTRPHRRSHQGRGCGRALPDPGRLPTARTRGVRTASNNRCCSSSGRPTDRSTLDKLTAYAAGGASGVKAAIEAHAYTSCDVVTVDSVDVDDVTYAGIDYLAAVFNLNIVGQGA
ncbi:hypothetical protein HCB39_28850 [Salinispora arenicola]|nr:hypothetical protein [Salinispora arenicola]